MENASSPTELFSREQILSGLALRRSRNVLFTIESRCAYAATLSRYKLNRFMTEEKARQNDMQFLESFSLGKEMSRPASIHDIERYWQEWVGLLPESALMRAALAHHLGEKYAFNPTSAPNLCRALKVEDAEIRAAFERLYQQPIESIYSQPVPLADRLRCLWARLNHWAENLPPFWTVFAVTVVETIGAGVLALPIALAGIGPIPGVVLLLLLGLINLITIIFTAEYLARSGAVHYGQGYVGQIISGYLGHGASIVFSLATIVLLILSVHAYYLGFSSSLAAITPIPAPVWALGICALSIYFIVTDSLNTSFVYSLLTGLLNIAIIVVLSMVALVYFKPANLMHANLPFVNGAPFDSSILQLIFGVLMFAYFGHMSINSCARLVVRRDPSSRSLIWGGAAAMGTIMLVYILWVLAINSAIPAVRLQQESGTALIPLAEYAGVSVLVLGTIFVVSNMGMSAVQLGMGLFGLVSERIPHRTQPLITLAQRRGRVFLSDKNDPAQKTALTYLGLQEDQVRLRIDLMRDGKPASLEIGLDERWSFPADAPGVSAPKGTPWSIELLESNARAVSLRFDTSLLLSYEGDWDDSGLNLAGLLDLPLEVRKLVGWMTRRQSVSLEALAAHLETGRNEALQIVDMLVAEGMFVESLEDGRPVYKPVFGRTRRSSMARSLLKQGSEAPGGGWVYPVWQRLLFGRIGRTLISLIPVFLVLYFTENALLFGSESFSKVISLGSVMTIPLLAGVFPVLLLVASRRKGEFIPSLVYHFLGNPLLLVVIYAINWAGLLVHALLWDNPVERGMALLTSLFLLGMSFVLWRRGVFTRQAVIRVDVQEQSFGGENVSLAVVYAGRELQAPLVWETHTGKHQTEASVVEMGLLSDLNKICLRLPKLKAGNLLVLVQRLSPEGRPLSQTGQVEIRANAAATQYDLQPAQGRVLVPFPETGCEVEIHLNS